MTTLQTAAVLALVALLVAGIFAGALRIIRRDNAARVDREVAAAFADLTTIPDEQRIPARKAGQS